MTLQNNPLLPGIDYKVCQSSFFGTPCNLFLEVGDYSEESPNKIKEEEKKTELRNAQKEIEDDPNVKSLVEAFGAKVIESSVEPRTDKWVI